MSRNFQNKKLDLISLETVADIKCTVDNQIFICFCVFSMSNDSAGCKIFMLKTFCGGENGKILLIKCDFFSS